MKLPEGTDALVGFPTSGAVFTSLKEIRSQTCCSRERRRVHACPGTHALVDSATTRPRQQRDVASATRNLALLLPAWSDLSARAPTPSISDAGTARKFTDSHAGSGSSAPSARAASRNAFIALQAVPVSVCDERMTPQTMMNRRFAGDVAPAAMLCHVLISTSGRVSSPIVPGAVALAAPMSGRGLCRFAGGAAVGWRICGWRRLACRLACRGFSWRVGWRVCWRVCWRIRWWNCGIVHCRVRAAVLALEERRVFGRNNDSIAPRLLVLPRARPALQTLPTRPHQRPPQDGPLRRRSEQTYSPRARSRGDRRCACNSQARLRRRSRKNELTLAKLLQREGSASAPHGDFFGRGGLSTRGRASLS